MRENVDIQNVVQNGYWTDTRAKDTKYSATPTSSSSYSYNDGIIPRTEPSRPRSLYRTHLRDSPPAPTVEDEAESLAKEHGSVISARTDEEPQHPGDVDQYPIIQLLHEHNPERRFVLVKNSSESSDDSSDTDNKLANNKRAERAEAREQPRPERKSSYEANTCRKYVLLSPEEEEAERKRDREARGARPNHERRKSRLEDLPAIVTNLDTEGRSDPRSRDIRRSKSATGPEPGADDYFSPRRSSRKIADDSMLSPDVIKHSTKGRDRAYFDYNGASSPNSQARIRPNQSEDPQYGRNVPNQRRNGETHTRPAPTSPIQSKRQSGFEAPQNVRRISKEGNDKSRQYPEAPPHKPSRTESASSHARPDRESVRPRSTSFRGKRESPPYDDDRYSSGEETKRRGDPRRRRKSIILDERNGHLATPSESKSSGGRRSKAPSPLASPRVSQGEIYGNSQDNEPFPSPRSSTFPSGKEPTEPPLSRASTARSVLNSAAPIAIPIITAAAAAAAATSESGTPIDRRSSALPPPKTRVVPVSQPHSRSSSSTRSSSPAKKAWQPPKFDPAKNAAQLDKPITSYRRYSEDISKGELPNLPDCPRMREEPGHVDWLTLPRCNNFNICPSCYQSAFQNTEFMHLFVPAPFRPRERPLKCDFGTSQWYHIAWLLTHKYQKPDLRLFHGIANVAASNQQCTGFRPDYRIWYTIKDPVSQRPVRNFNICHSCAKIVEVLLPNLSGAFVPMDSPAEPSRGICALHQQGYGGERKRFISYWDFMETTSDDALASNRAPDIRSLADKVRELSLIDECLHSYPVPNRKWYTMRSIPDMTICEECFMEVVWPELERENSGVQADVLHRPRVLQLAACQLYTPRMRSVFKKAVRRNDLQYFESRVRQRKAKEQECNAKIAALDVYASGQEWVDKELERIQEDWRRYE